MGIKEKPIYSSKIPYSEKPIKIAVAMMIKMKSAILLDMAFCLSVLI